MHVIRCLVLLGSVALSLRAGAAFAQPAQPAPAVDKAKAKVVAKQYVDAGLAAQDSGDYDTAITFYSKAYQLVPHPVLIFNMAQAHRLAGRIDQAMTLYARYLKEDPNGAQAQTARDLIAEVVARKAEEARKIEDARKAEEARKADEARTADEARKARALEAARMADQQRAAQQQRTAAAARGPGQPDAPDRDPGRSLRIAGIAAGATGVAGIGIGIGFGLHAAKLSDDLSKPNAPYDPAKVDAGHRANTVQVIGLVGGTALVALGATLYWRGHVQGKRHEGVALAPMISEHVAGLAVSGLLP